MRGCIFLLLALTAGIESGRAQNPPDALRAGAAAGGHHARTGSAARRLLLPARG
jgi:hypothetical protein